MFACVQINTVRFPSSSSIHPGLPQSFAPFLLLSVHSPLSQIIINMIAFLSLSLSWVQFTTKSDLQAWENEEK